MNTADRIYELLPRVYRLRDELSNGQLRQLIEVIAGQIDVLEESLDQFYDDLFIETAADWVVPYIGDLVGYRPLHGGPPSVASPRAEVANTIAYRRRKGTAAMLEQLAFDVTGWRARAVEFFERLAVTQYMNHPRPGKGATVDTRQWLPLTAAFDERAHLAEMRRGRHNIHNVGVFLWRLDAVELSRSPLVAHPGSHRRFRFHPLGIDHPLFGKPRTEEEITHIAEPFDVPLPLTRRWLKDHWDAYYGLDRSLLVGLLGAATPSDFRVCDLSDVGNDWAHAPTDGVVAIDPVLGRVYFPFDVTGPVTAIGTFHYGSPFEIGGGGYHRTLSTTEGPLWTVSGGADVQAQLEKVKAGGVVEIQDNWRYKVTPSITAGSAKTVVLRSADRRRPLIAADGPIKLKPGPGATVVIDGLLISEGALELDDTGDLEPRTIILRHCTLVPGAATSLTVSHPFATVAIERCVLGPIKAVEGVTLSIRDSVIDASTGGSLMLDESTVIGQVQATRVDISNSIVLGKVTAQRRQEGCVRFSRIPDGSLTPSRYNCTSLPPSFTSLRFGDPGYGQLRVSTPDEIRRGADNESEMGAGNYLFAPQREANLRLRLDEYLRFGLEAGIFYAT